jgi:hypothetical protein
MKISVMCRGQRYLAARVWGHTTSITQRGRPQSDPGAFTSGRSLPAKQAGGSAARKKSFMQLA